MKINKLIILLSVCGLAIGCTQNEDIAYSNSKDVHIIASIGENTEARATNRTDDNLSYASFKKDDEAGMFASEGLVASNTLLTATSSSVFKSDELQWFNKPAKNVYCYFPRSSDAERVDIWREASVGNWKEGFDDMLAASNSNVAEGAIISLGFSHQFAILAITRGKGFDEKTSEITVNLNKKVSKEAKIKYDGTALNQCAIEIQEDAANGINELKTNLYNKVDYVIVPVGIIDGTPTNIASLTLENNAGRIIKINYNFDETKGFEKNQKYHFTVEMRDNQAVVSPTEIVRWDEENIEIIKPKGISSIDDLTNWASAYNGTDGKQDITELKNYGTCDDNGKWTFLLLENLPNSTDTNTSISYSGILEFKDIFDGQGHTISGIKIEESTAGDTYPTGFIRTLKDGGEIKRLILKNAILKGKSKVGAFAGETEAGTKITDVKLIGSSIIYGTSEVGAIVGSQAEAGTVTNFWVESGVFVSKTK